MIEVPKAKESVWDEKGTWGPIITRNGNPASPIIHCPICDHSSVLSAHDILEDGTVTAPGPQTSVQCPTQGCAFHDQVRLLDWTYGKVMHREEE